MIEGTPRQPVALMEVIPLDVRKGGGSVKKNKKVRAREQMSQKERSERKGGNKRLIAPKKEK